MALLGFPIHVSQTLPQLEAINILSSAEVLVLNFVFCVFRLKYSW